MALEALGVEPPGRGQAQGAQVQDRGISRPSANCWGREEAQASSIPSGLPGSWLQLAPTIHLLCQNSRTPHPSTTQPRLSRP